MGSHTWLSVVGRVGGGGACEGACESGTSSVSLPVVDWVVVSFFFSSSTTGCFFGGCGYNKWKSTLQNAVLCMLCCALPRRRTRGFERVESGGGVHTPQGLGLEGESGGGGGTHKCTRR